MKLKELLEAEVSPWQALTRALKQKKRNINLENIIIKDVSQAYEYAKVKLQGRWPEAEPVIMKSPVWAYHYARDVINGRWPEAEPFIITSPQYAVKYATDIIKGRWLTGEPVILNIDSCAFDYFIYLADITLSKDDQMWLLTNTQFIKKFNTEYIKFIKKTFKDNSLLMNKWLRYAENIKNIE